MIERQLVGDRLCDSKEEQETPRRFRGAIKNSRVVPVGERRKQTSRRAASLPICLMIPHSKIWSMSCRRRDRLSIWRTD